MKKIILSITAAIALSFSAKAQDEAIFSHYIINPMLINPAAAGFNENVQIFGHMRNQFAGFTGAPKTYALTVDLPVTEKVGLGGLLLSEKFGTTNRTKGQLNYSYRYVGKGIKWSAGFSTEFQKNKIDASINDDQLNPLNDKNDQLVIDRIKGVTIFDAAFGATALINEKFLLSFTTPNLIRAVVGGDVNAVKTDRTFFRQFILMGGYRITKSQIVFEPSMQFRKVYNSPFEVDVNLKASVFENKLVAALQVRPGNSGQVGLLVGTKQPGFSIYYSYNSSFSDFKAYDRTAHEVTLGIEIKKSEKKIERGAKRYRN
jgi:type IX secretion system PorP/SprF family membrane protein